MSPKPNDKQVEAMGQVVADEIGSNLQTGYYGDGWFYIYTKQSPNSRVKYHYFDPEGTVLIDSPFSPPGVKRGA
jgi:hypothetical protein